MKYVVAMMAVVGLAMLGCGSSFDNVGACEEAQTAINTWLEDCESTFEVDMTCSTYDSDAYSSCDIADFFTCWADAYNAAECTETPDVTDCTITAC